LSSLAAAAAAAIGGVAAIVALICVDLPIPGYVMVLLILLFSAAAGLTAGTLARKRRPSAESIKRLVPLVVAAAFYGWAALGLISIVRYSPDESIWRAGWVYLIIGLIAGSLNVAQFIIDRRRRSRSSNETSPNR
jgi:hypothetical protein